MYKEKVKIEDALVIYIRDKKTGKVTKKWIKKLWKDMTLWEKILHILHIKRQPGTVTSTGLNNIAKAYGNTSPRYPDKLSAHSTSGWTHVSMDSTYPVVVGNTLTLRNLENPFPGGSAYDAVGWTNTSDGDSVHGSISVDVDLSSQSNLDFWVEIEIVFSAG